MASPPDYYAVLEVPPDANIDEIKRNHRRLARRFHPDLESASNEARMKEINDAYSILGNEDKRKQYDAEFGHNSAATKTTQEAAERARAAKERAERMRAARAARRRSNAETKAYGDRIRGKGQTSQSPPPHFRPTTHGAQPYAANAPQATGHTPFAPPPRRPPVPTPPRSTPAPPGRTSFLSEIPPVVILIILALIAFAIHSLGASSKARPQPAPARTPQEISAQESALARVSHLHFACRVRYMCTLAPFHDGDVPLFIAGMDPELASYLEQHGYTDSWRITGDPYGETATTIGRKAREKRTREYVYKAPSGSLSGLRLPLIYSPVGLESNGIPAGRWPATITWTLTAPSGNAIRNLSYKLDLIECNAREEEARNGEDYCKKVLYYIGKLENTGNASNGIDAASE
jgi:DnaJ-domain-containing protein 1